MGKTDSLGKTLILGKTEGEKKGQQKMGWLDGIIDSIDINVITLGDSEVQGSLECYSLCCHKELNITE